jgi:hypothetical protein
MSSGVSQISVNGYHSCAIVASSGALYCWGYNGDGRLGDGTTTIMNCSPVLVSGMSSGVRFISAGRFHSCAIKTVGIMMKFLALNPIGAVIVGIAALIALIVIIVKNWDDIKVAASNAWGRIKEIVTSAKDFIVDKLKALGQWIIENHPLLKLFRAVRDFAPTVLKWFRDLGGDIMDGLKNGIVGAATGFVTAIKNAVKGGVDAVKKLLKIQSPSRVFMGIGENVVAGYIKGVEGMGNALDQTMSGFTMDQTVQLNGSVGASSGTGAPSLAPVYNINVNAGMGADGAAIGREIVDAIKRYERTSGPVFASA